MAKKHAKKPSKSKQSKKADKAERTWRPITVAQEFYAVSGGRDNKPHILKTMEIDTRGGKQYLVGVTKQDRWLISCAAGTQAGRGTLKRCQALIRLKAALTAVTTSQDAGQAAAEVAAAAGPAAADDPMDALDAVDETTESPTPKKTKKRYKKLRVENAIFSVEMSILPEEAGTAAQEAGTRRVSVMARGAKSLFIDVADLDWLITYVAKELELGGVSVVPPAAVLASEVAGGGDTEQPICVQWVFGDDPAWEATILTGELQGKTVKCRLANLCADKWASLGTAVAVPLEEATFEHKKEGARVYIETYCAGLMHRAALDAA